MSLPKIDFHGQFATITMMEFRRNPGEVIERVKAGLTVVITKAGKPIAKLAPVDTVVLPDGTIIGEKPLTMGLDLGSEYGHA